MRVVQIERTLHGVQEVLRGLSEGTTRTTSNGAVGAGDAPFDEPTGVRTTRLGSGVAREAARRNLGNKLEEIENLKRNNTWN